MAARLSWSSLVPGLIALTLLVAIGVAVLTYGSVGRVAGDKIRLHVLTDQARGVMPGTEVWIQGQRVGTVEKISFREPSTDTMQRVVLSVDVRARDAGQIRRDSEIRVRTGANVVGPIVVYITGGTPGSAPVHEGDTLRATTHVDAENALRGLEAATAEAAPLLADARTVLQHVRDRRGTLGAALAERGGPQAGRLGSNIARLRGSLDATATERDELRARASAALARVDSVRALLRSDHGSLGRFRRDSSLVRTVAHLHDEVDSLRQRMAEERGTLGRFSSDSAVTRALAAARQEMAKLFEDMRKRPLRYVAF